MNQELVNLRARMVFLAQQVTCKQIRAAQLTQVLTEQKIRLSALDSTINIADSTVAPNATGVVRATGGRYGGASGLKAFIVSTLRDAAPAALQIRMIARAAAVHFGLDFSSQGEFLDFLRNSVKHQIVQLKARPRRNCRRERQESWQLALEKSVADLATLAAA